MIVDHTMTDRGPPQSIGQGARPSILFHVQHLKGIGHTMRVHRIATRLAAHGVDAIVASGGSPIEELDWGDVAFVQLPVIRAAETGYDALHDRDGAPLSDAIWQQRSQQLERVLDQFSPSVLVTEGFPFARRKLAPEVLALISRFRSANARSAVVASVRDIIEPPRKPERRQESIAIWHASYDHVLVHAEPGLSNLTDVFGAPPVGRGHVTYTGLVGPGTPHRSSGGAPDGSRDFDVVISIGSGAYGPRVIEAAIEAKALTPLANGHWLALTGESLPDRDVERLSELGRQAGVAVERFRPDLARLLGSAELSIQRAGYNTVAELLETGCRAVLVPYDGAGEQEQTLRAEKLASAGRAVTVAERSLDGRTLAAAIRLAVSRPKPEPRRDLDGADVSARLLAGLATGLCPSSA